MTDLGIALAMGPLLLLPQHRKMMHSEKVLLQPHPLMHQVVLSPWHRHPQLMMGSEMDLAMDLVMDLARRPTLLQALSLMTALGTVSEIASETNPHPHPQRLMMALETALGTKGNLTHRGGRRRNLARLLRACRQSHLAPLSL